jgi:putative transposase
VRVLNELVAVHGRPHLVATHYIQAGKPDQNAYIERVNRSYRTEVLNAHLFESIRELKAITRRLIDNSERVHDSLGRVPPLTFLPRPSSVVPSSIGLSA